MRAVRRVLLLVVCLTTCAGVLHAQDQEGKLVDRLLRPDMSLVNPQQNKRFVAAEGTSVDRKFEAKSYSGTKELPTKSFLGLREFFFRVFGANKFSRGDTVANAIHVEPVDAHAVALTKKSSLIKTAPEASKSFKTRPYADNRPFLGKGTRQKILSQQDHPLSIEEVRKLLNKDNSATDSP